MIRDSEEIDSANIWHIGEALSAVFEIQLQIYRRRPDLTHWALKPELVGEIYESWDIYRDRPDLRVPIDAANEKSRRLRELVLAPEILVMPGAWDPLSAILFEHLGFQAIQCSSSAIAATLGYQDGEVIDRRDTTRATKLIAAAVSVPVSADGEAGYGGPDETAHTVHLIIRSGAAGMNLEDSIPTGPTAAGRSLASIADHLEKIAAVLEAKRAMGSEFFLNARVDAFLVMEDQKAGLAEAVARGNIYAEMGADCIFYIRAGGAETIATLVREVQAPVSILADASAPSVQELQDLGVARVSYGAALTRAALSGAQRFAEVLLAKGDPRPILQASISTPELNQLFKV